MVGALEKVFLGVLKGGLLQGLWSCDEYFWSFGIGTSSYNILRDKLLVHIIEESKEKELMTAKAKTISLQM